MFTALLVFLAACGSDGDADSGGGARDDGTADDSSVADDSAPDDSAAPDDSGCAPIDWYQDVDIDGYGAGAVTAACEAPGDDWVEASGDCDDGNAAVNPDATEICNSVDDDCDELVDADDPTLQGTDWYPDLDADGYGDPTGTPVTGCGVADYAPNATDCDDADATTFPGAAEICDDIQQNCDTVGWTSDEGVATWYPASGGAEDWTATMAAGVAGKPADILLTDDGELVVCDGTWYVHIEVKTADVVVRGLHGSALTTLSSGDAARNLGVLKDFASVELEGISFVEGNFCYGSALSTMQVVMCSAGGASANYTMDVDLVLRDVRVENQTPTLVSLSTIYIAYGTLVMEDSAIAGNTTEGLTALNTPVNCTGSSSNDAGIWGNFYGVFLWNLYGTSPFPFVSTACDFDGTMTGSGDDISLQYSSASGDPTNHYDFGDDESFVCDTMTTLCE